MAEDLFFEDGERVTLSFEEFMEMVLDLRGGQGATVKDVMSLGKRFSHKFMTQKIRMDNVEKKMDNTAHKMDGLLKYYGLEVPNYHTTTYHHGSTHGNLEKLMKDGTDKLRSTG